MARWTLGCVPYVNARPLAEALDHSGEVEMRYAPPSELAKWLERGEVDAALVSSIHCLQSGSPAADGVCIGSDGPVQSVRLFSRIPWDDVQTVALDKSSLTSCALSRVVLGLRGLAPTYEILPPDLESMLAEHDAALIIGDAGYEASAHGLHVLDLGEEWLRLTGLPFVWAVWEMRSADADLAGLLASAWVWSQANWDQVISGAVERSGWTVQACEDYLQTAVKFSLDSREKQGLARFRELAAAHVDGLGAMPQFIGGTTPTPL